MHIEVTSETFYSVFNENPIKTEVKELCEKAYFFNSKLNQRGFKIFNFSSSKMYQYYLTDINA